MQYAVLVLINDVLQTLCVKLTALELHESLGKRLWRQLDAGL